MTDRQQYAPGPASGAEVQKGGEKWTLILVRDTSSLPSAMAQVNDPKKAVA